MRKLFYLGFCLVLAMGVGCAITDYELMFDSYSGEIINTNGKADIIPSSQVATIWPDGADNLFTMVDQKANGDRTLTTYNFFTTDGTYFTDTTYCSPDWTGCAIWTAPDPEVGDVDPFDGAWNQNCAGSRSLSSLIGTTRYYGECGRSALSVQDRMALASAGAPKNEFTLTYNLTAANTSLFFDNNSGVKSLVPFLGNVGVELDVRGGREMLVRIDNPLFQNTLKSAADWAENYGSGFNTVTISFNGVEKSINANLMADNMRAKANRL